MSLFSFASWEDMNEPLRKITHPDTKTLLTFSVLLLTAVAVLSFTITPSFVSAGIIGFLGFVLGMRNIIVNNTKLNPVSSGAQKHVINAVTTVMFIWLAFFILAGLATEIGAVLQAITPVKQ